MALIDFSDINNILTAVLFLRQFTANNIYMVEMVNLMNINFSLGDLRI
jgi:hypothetical protein